MGLFDEAYAEIVSLLEGRKKRGEAGEYPVSRHDWPEEKSLVMKADTAVELGSPGSSSLMMILWTPPGRMEGDRIYLVGPDLAGAGVSALPFGQVVMASGDFGDEYDTYREIREAVYNFDLKGITSRALPSTQSTWLRISRDALAGGFSLEVIGNALAGRVKRVAGVETVQVALLTDHQAIEELRPAGERVQGILGALTRMNEEMDFDCDSCEYVDVCDEVTELREIRDKMIRKNE